ncbi:MAG: hypothetical protein JST91_01815 [Actinobacteria bacterium]|nr:hypothetical protein [Actinomycetota bacterium]
MSGLDVVTLHFDLGHLGHLAPDQQFTLKTPGGHRRLTRHTPQTRREHAARNAALGMLSEAQLARLSHFADTVSLADDAVSFCWVGYPSARRGAVCDESAVVFQHAPAGAVRRAVRAMRRDGVLPTPSSLLHLGVQSVADHADAEELHVAAATVISLRDTAQTMIMQHPEIGTLIPDTHVRIAKQLITVQPCFTDLVSYLSGHPPEGSDPWYENTYVTDLEGNVMPPDTHLPDKTSTPVHWPTTDVDGEDDVAVIPQHRLSEGLDEVLGTVVRVVGTALKQQPWLKGQQWSTQHAVTEIARSGEPVLAAPNSEAAQARWTVANTTSTFGLEICADTINFDPIANWLTFSVKNWAGRTLGAYVQFVDINGAVITQPETWPGQFPDDMSIEHRQWVQPNAGKKFVKHIGPSNTIFGIPVWADAEALAFPIPKGAVGANVMLGGLGNGNWDMDVDRVGLVYTCVVSYGIPSLLSLLSVGVKSTTWYTDVFKNPSNMMPLITVSAIPFTQLLAHNVDARGAEQTAKRILVAACRFVAGIVFSSAMKFLGTKIAAYLTEQQILQSAPFVGWALKVASVACAIADMVATSIEVGCSPATYQLEARRSMSLDVTLTPARSAGTDTQQPIWPKLADHYVIQVSYPGGLTLTRSGRIPEFIRDKPVRQVFSLATGDALPSAQGQQFQVTANVYSAKNWLCGQWVSDWIDAVPTDGDMRRLTGAITEMTIPLVPDTRYQFYAKLGYSAEAKTYVWLRNREVPTTTAAGLARQDVREPVAITLSDEAKKLGYCYRARNQNLPVDNSSTPGPDEMFLFKSISTLDKPGRGMLSPTRGFSVRPAIAYGEHGYYLDTRTFAATKLSHLRPVTLTDGESTFDYAATVSWGAFGVDHLNAMAVHPDGYVAGIATQYDKLMILTLPEAGCTDKSAPVALPFCGTGEREGLLIKPVALTISSDGRILVLEQGNARIQAFDIHANPVQCFSGALAFDLPGEFAAQLDDAAASTALLKALQTRVPVLNTAPSRYNPRYLAAPVFGMPGAVAAVLDAGTVTADLAAQFDRHAMTLGEGAAIVTTARGIWLLTDPANGVNYDIRLNGEGVDPSEVDVYRCFTPAIDVVAKGAEWAVIDRTNALRFSIKAGDAGTLKCRILTSVMRLKPVTTPVTYLDVAVESKGFLYVQSYANNGSNPADYHLDIYNPDGTPLNDTAHQGQIVAARMAVDQARTLYALHYDQLQGPAGRAEPVVSQWSPPDPGA